MKRFFSLALSLIVFIIILSMNQPIFADSYEDNFLRIRLTNPLKTKETVKLQSNDGFFIYEMEDLLEEIEHIDVTDINVVMDGQNEEILMLDAEDNILFSFEQKDLLISSNKEDKRIKVEDKEYRDYIGFKIIDDELLVINYVDLEHYLYGVIPREMPAHFELEALKAQAIAARTYTLKNINKHEDKGYDLCDTTCCQVYGGMNGENERTNIAVDKTKGMFATYNGDIINAVYHSNSGGYTENVDEVWGNNLPYLSAVNDEFAKDSPNSRWNLMVTSDEISAKLYNSGIRIGDVLDLLVLDTSSTGRVSEIKVIGTLGQEILTGSQIREILGVTELKSTMFTISKENIKNEESTFYAIDGKKSTPQLIDLNDVHIIDSNLNKTSSRGIGSRFINRNGTIEIDSNVKPSKSNFIIEGEGYGHGIGMSQWGAQGMATSGYSYDEILKHYYNGVEIINEN